MPVAVLLLLLLCWRAEADDISLSRVTENWKYFKGTNEPSPIPKEWSAVGFDDSLWLESLSSISTPFIYGETTQLPDYGYGYRSIYFRRNFVLSEIDRIAQLTLRIDYDDGFIAYINGKEVVRRGVTGEVDESVPYDAYATYHPRGYTEEIDVSGAITNLRAGTNLLAIQLLGSSTNDFTACMIAELMANFSRAPYVQNTTTNSTYIVWKTLWPAPSFIEFGTNAALISRVNLGSTDTNHVAILSELLPDTSYFYRIGAILNGKEAVCDWRTFRTFKISGPVAFEVLGDSGWASPAQLQIAQQLEQQTEDLVFHVGDVLYGGYSNFAADFRFFSIYGNQLRRTPMFFAFGNHDNYGDLLALISHVYLPTNSATGTEHYYSFDHGDVHFIALWLDLEAHISYAPGSLEYHWLEQDLASAQKPWKLMFFHHTWRSSSLHGAYDDYDTNGVPDSVQIQESVVNLANRYGVQVIYNGHDHAYERLTPSGGTLSFVTGGGGARLYGFYKAHPDDVQFYNSYNFLTVKVDGEELETRALTPSGALLDSFHYRKAFPERKEWIADWHSPSISLQLANDGDGNVFGQSFDFTGEPIPSKTGGYSAAGRIFVNNDDDYLYLGIDEAGLRSDQNLFLFIQSGGLTGVSGMAQLGNGMADPQGEAVDGLDFLKNLNFTNFAPAIAVLLGDEMGDGPSRSFVRPGLSLDIGQGAFYLSNGFPVVPGQKLEQFNHSPQDYAVTYEQNANYVKLAVPFSSLGNLQPGDKIKLALISGLAGVDTNALTRTLDNGGVAYNIITNNNLVTVEGVEVALATNPDPSLRLKVSLMDAPAGSARLKWNTVPGKSYQLEFSDTLTNDWRDISDPIFPKVATGVSDSYMVSRTEPTLRYYRVKVLP